MAFADDLQRFTLKMRGRTGDVFVGVAAAVKDSIVNGSPITGSPGQPVDTGFLKNSWQLVFDSPTLALIETDTVYAPNIEDGIAASGKQMHLRSAVGGFHSVALTRAGFQRIVNTVVAEVVGT